MRNVYFLIQHLKNGHVALWFENWRFLGVRARAPHYSFREYNKWFLTVASALCYYTFWESARMKVCYGSYYKSSNRKKKKMVQFKHLQLFFAKYNFIPTPLPVCWKWSNLACQWWGEVVAIYRKVGYPLEWFTPMLSHIFSNIA